MYWRLSSIGPVANIRQFNVNDGTRVRTTHCAGHDRSHVERLANRARINRLSLVGKHRSLRDDSQMRDIRHLADEVLGKTIHQRVERWVAGTVGDRQNSKTNRRIRGSGGTRGSTNAPYQEHHSRHQNQQSSPGNTIPHPSPESRSGSSRHQHRGRPCSGHMRRHTILRSVVFPGRVAMLFNGYRCNEPVSKRWQSLNKTRLAGIIPKLLAEKRGRPRQGRLLHKGALPDRFKDGVFFHQPPMLRNQQDQDPQRLRLDRHALTVVGETQRLFVELESFKEIDQDPSPPL